MKKSQSTSFNHISLSLGKNIFISNYQNFQVSVSPQKSILNLKCMSPLVLVSCFFLLCWVFVAACGRSLVVVSRAYTLVAMRGLLTEVTSLIAED